MSSETLTECADYRSGIYHGRHTGFTIIELDQHRFIDIVVNKNNPIIRTLDKTADKFMRIKYLSVEEYTFFWRQGCAYKEINPIGQLIKSFYHAPANVGLCGSPFATAAD